MTDYVLGEYIIVNRADAVRATDNASPDETLLIDWSQQRCGLLQWLRRRVSDPQTAEDLVQESLLRAHRQLQVEVIRNLSAWLRRTAMRVLVDHYRAQRLRRAAVVEDVAVVDPGESSAAAELSGCVRAMLTRLEHADRQALEQTDLGELSQLQLAQQLGLSVPGGKSRVQHARKKLRQSMLQCCQPQLNSSGEVVGHSCGCRPPEYCSGRQGKC